MRHIFAGDIKKQSVVLITAVETLTICRIEYRRSSARFSAFQFSITIVLV
jgi:hypothetical protein